MKKTMTGIVLLCACSAHAETLSEGAVACTTENKFDEMMSAIVDDDERGIRYMLNNGCIVTNGQFEASVLDRTWTGKVKVRAYSGDDAIVLWTNMESIN